jgi:selenide,water dikinase
MGGRPITVLNIACFNPVAAPASVWAEVLKGAYDKTVEAGAVVVGGHSIMDKEPKFGLSVTGLVNPNTMFTNDNARPGDRIYLSKPLGTGIVTTMSMKDKCPANLLKQAIESMSKLNKEACEIGQKYGVRCATDITGFGLAGHLLNIARSSSVAIEVDTASLPLFEGLQNVVVDDAFTAGLFNNEIFTEQFTEFDDGVPEWLRKVALDPQTSGGLALFSQDEIPGMPCIGRVVEGAVQIRFA